MQTDPIGYEDGISWYAYVGNDPINGRDPSGTSCERNDGSVCGCARDFFVGDVEDAIAKPSATSIAIAVVTTAFKPAKVLDKVIDGAQTLRKAERVVEKGARNPVIREAAEAGRKAHKEWDPGQGYRKEFTLENGKRADAFNFDAQHVKELKPDNPRAIARGERQVEGHRQQLERQTGEKWTCSVETYCRK